MHDRLDCVHAVIERRLYPQRGVHSRVAHEIGRQVVSGVIAEGALLPRETELSRQFAVSRQAVREGLKVLAAKGLVYAPSPRWHRRPPAQRVEPSRS